MNIRNITARLRQTFRYRFNQMISRGSAVHYLVLALVALSVVLLGINAYFFGLFSPDALQSEGIDNDLGGGFLDSFWWSMKHVVDPGAFAEDYGAPWPVLAISLALSVIGLSLLGIFIGFVTTSVQGRLEQLRQGRTEVMETGHTLILGWSNKIGSILGFLDQFGDQRVVAILAPNDMDDMQSQLRLQESWPWQNLDIILRTGSTSSLMELQRVGLKRAASVISLAHGQDGRSAHETDIETIKTLMLLSGFDSWQGQKPRMVAEIAQKRNVDIARIAGARSIPLVSSSEIISKVIVQSARQPGISSVYAEIFSRGDNRSFVFACPDAVDKRFGDVAHWFPDAVLIGVAWHDDAGRAVAALNPEPDYEIAADELLVLTGPTAMPVYDKDHKPGVFEFDGDSSKITPHLEKLLVFGWNENIDEILGELDAHSSTDAVVTVVAGHDEEYARDFLESCGVAGFKNIRVDYRQGNAINRSTVEQLDLSSYDCLMTLADDSHGGDDPDTRTIMTLLQLGDVPLKGNLPHVVCEIYDGANEELLRQTIAADIIVSPEMASLQLAQISSDLMLGSIYREILNAGGIEVRLQPAGRYVGAGRSCCFRDIVSAGQKFAEIAIGIRQAGKNLRLNPNKDEILELTAADEVVVLAQQLYE
jgi:hypothetical protein